MKNIIILCILFCFGCHSVTTNERQIHSDLTKLTLDNIDFKIRVVKDQTNKISKGFSKGPRKLQLKGSLPDIAHFLSNESGYAIDVGDLPSNEIFYEIDVTSSKSLQLTFEAVQFLFFEGLGFELIPKELVQYVYPITIPESIAIKQFEGVATEIKIMDKDILLNKISVADFKRILASYFNIIASFDNGIQGIAFENSLNIDKDGKAQLNDLGFEFGEKVEQTSIVYQLMPRK
jgi:hypothetical protein